MARKYVLRPETAVLTRGYDPSLSVGSARPAVFRSSTYVFSSPEAAARAFEIALGKARPAPGENVDLIYARLSHPNAQILEEQIVPLWYARDDDGLPRGWLDRMRRAAGTSLWDFSTTRMLAEYVEQMYLPTAGGTIAAAATSAATSVATAPADVARAAG